MSFLDELQPITAQLNSDMLTSEQGLEKSHNNYIKKQGLINKFPFYFILLLLFFFGGGFEWGVGGRGRWGEVQILLLNAPTIVALEYQIVFLRG